MIPIKQRLHNDCVRASVASILERTYDEVPHFAQQAEDTGRWWGACIDDWLFAEGYPFRHGNFAFDLSNGPKHAVFMESFWLGQPWWFATVRSKINDGLHSIVMHGNDVAFDPGIHADRPENLAKPYEFSFANYFYVPEPAAARRTRWA